MKILTFDTSLNSMYVTISNDGKILSSKIVESNEEKYHSAYLIPVIVELLQKNNLTMSDIEAVGVNIGPGSFTGIRAGVTVARVIGQQLGIPVIGVPSLQILSFMNPTQKESLCLLDARKGKAYAGIYSEGAAVVSEPEAIEYEKVIEQIKENDFYLISDLRMYKLLLEQEIETNTFEQSGFDFGVGLAQLTYKLIEKNGTEKYCWYNAKPLYIQPPPISMPKNAVKAN